MINAPEALRDVLRGIGASETWIRSEREMNAVLQAQQAQNEAQQALMGATAGADIAEKLGSAAKDFGDAGVQQGAA